MTDDPKPATTTPPASGAQSVAAPAPVAPPATSDQMTSMMIDQARKLNPAASAWWMGLIQGILATGLGLLFFMRPSGLAGVILQFVALFLVIVGLMDMMAGMSIGKRNTVQNIEFWRGMVGFFGGLTLLSLVFLNYFDTPEKLDFGAKLIGSVLVAYGALGVILAFMRKAKRGRWTLVIVSAIFVFLGISLLTGTIANLAATWIAPVLTVLGIGLIVYSFMRRSREKDALAAVQPAA